MNGIVTRKTLIARIKDSNDNESWETFCDSYQGYIFIIIRNMGVPYHDSQELLQEVLIKAWQSMPNFEYNPEKGKFRWWLCTIVKNTVYNYFLKEKRKLNKMNANESLNESVLSNFTEPEVDKLAEEEWKKFVVKKAWENIIDEFSDNVIEVFSELSAGKEVKEIATEFNIEENTVHVYKSRVTRRLYREIAKIDYELNC